jgi:hypothetical protein
MLKQLFQPKSLDAILSEGAAPEHQFKRALGAFDATMLGIGAIIGAGIFATAQATAASCVQDSFRSDYPDPPHSVLPLSDARPPWDYLAEVRSMAHHRHGDLFHVWVSAQHIAQLFERERKTAEAIGWKLTI